MNRKLKEQSFITFTFTFMHLADAFIQSDLHCIKVTVFPGNRTHDLGVASAMLYHLSYRKAFYNIINAYNDVLINLIHLC